MAGAAAETGYDLDAVEAVAGRANDRTRSIEATFDGCTLPGAENPLFTHPQDTIAWGLGVGGEPGVGKDGGPRPSRWSRSWSAGCSRMSRPMAGPG